MKCPFFAIVAITTLVPFAALGQTAPISYPNKPIRFVVPYPPGGGSDLVGRVVAEHLLVSLGKQVQLDNRPGAAGMIGCEIVAKSPPDGYTLLVTTQGPISINPGLFAKMPYDPVRDFAPITLLASYSTVLSTHPSLPVRSVKELISFAKAHPDQILYASGGTGTTQHLSGELLNIMAGINMVHVPYKGGGPALIALLGGEVSVGFASPGLVLPYRNSGKVTLLATTGAKRSPAFPDLPTIAETLPGFDSIAWIGLFAPHGAPRDIVVKLHREVAKILQAPDVRRILASQNYDVVGNSPEQFSEYIKQDVARWSNVIKKAGVKAD